MKKRINNVNGTKKA